MKIRYYDIADSLILYQVYNEQFANVPHCYAVSPEEFEAGFGYQKFERDFYCEDINSEKIIVVEENRKIIGFSDVAVAEIYIDGKEKGQKLQRGFIRFLTYQPGYRSAGQMLIEESERYLYNLGMKQISAFRLNYTNDHCGYHFYHLGYSMISDKMNHICALFGMNGYIKNGGEMFLNQPEYKVSEPILLDNKIEIATNQKSPIRANLPGLTVEATRNGKWVGNCSSISAGEFCLADNAQDWVFITGLFIEKLDQGKGLGRYLLQKNLWEMQNLGYRNSVISTDWRNYRAQLFYTNYGYQIADTNYEFAKVD
jgi:GNAT superfamily N-acetyltransferase